MDHQLLNFVLIDECEISKYEPLAGSYAVIMCEGKYLICFNKWRKQWELPAGKREEDESPKECAIRELFEETTQLINDMEFKGLAKVRKPNGKLKHNPVYFAILDTLAPFKDNEETEKIMLWDLKEDIGRFDELDMQILNVFVSRS